MMMMMENVQQQPIDLLYIESEDIDENNKKSAHYALIEDFKKLIFKSLAHDCSYEVVRNRCIIGFTYESAYNKHL